MKDKYGANELSQKLKYHIQTSGRIQDESMNYEMLKHTCEYPSIGVNTFRNPYGDPVNDTLELARSTDEEKQSQLKRLQQAVIDNANVFEVGGQYRRNM